jgi:hypothetical protein
MSGRWVLSRKQTFEGERTQGRAGEIRAGPGEHEDPLARLRVDTRLGRRVADLQGVVGRLVH